MSGDQPHLHSIEKVLESLSSSLDGLSKNEAIKRLRKYGKNTIPQKEAAGLIKIFLRQFLSPFIYILLIAAVVSCFLRHWQDAIFIGAVLLINAIVGTVQEFSAERSAEALKNTVKTHATVLREGKKKRINSYKLVPGDIIFLQSGDKVPADLRLIESQNLTINESLLTGESQAINKQPDEKVKEGAPIGDRINMAFAGTLVVRGRGKGVVTATSLQTEVGHMSDILEKEKEKSQPPLVIRMKKFTYQVALCILGAVILVFLIELLRGSPWDEVFILSVALAVSAIPGGLPIALTVALAIGTKRMADRHVIVRRLVAVEALGSCTFIASDKTGTLTVNELTVGEIVFPGEETPCKVSGEGLNPEGEIKCEKDSLVSRLLRTAILCNEAEISKRDHDWEPEGDMVDVALLVLGEKWGIQKEKQKEKYDEIAAIPYESENSYAATLNTVDGKPYFFIKGALERLLPMCSQQAEEEKDQPIDKEKMKRQGEDLAERGFRVLAFVEGEAPSRNSEVLQEENFQNLTLVGLVGMIDPLRPEVEGAVKECQDAGIEVAMVTGDHPKTAFAIAHRLDFAKQMDQVVTGQELEEAKEKDEQELDKLVEGTKVFARVEPTQKVDIVNALKRTGHFIAVTGDGANDAPALAAANVGVAMGKRGTDVARESAEILLTDDNFASIVHGIEEGRIAFRNVRKVVFLLISTSAAEVVLFGLALLFNLPLPFLATQLLWLNMITNGIQDVALSCEPKEVDEMQTPPRDPKEPIFNALMLERVIISGVYMGIITFILFKFLLMAGFTVENARNSALLLMVLFENVHVFNSRSEYLSVFQHNPLRNLFLLFGTILAQLVHIGAMYTPWLNRVLEIHPVPFLSWLMYLGIALSLLLVMEAEKYVRKKVVK